MEVVKNANGELVGKQIDVAQPVPFIGTWKGVIQNRLVKIILETTSQSQTPVGWNIWVYGDIEHKNMLSSISYDEKKGIINFRNDAVENNDKIDVIAWISPCSCASMMIGLNNGTCHITLMKCI